MSLIASEEGDAFLSMVGVAEAEKPPAGQFGRARGITLGQLQVSQMASLESVSVARFCLCPTVDTSPIDCVLSARALLKMHQRASGWR